jgi:hypothetical protein
MDFDFKKLSVREIQAENGAEPAAASVSEPQEEATTTSEEPQGDEQTMSSEEPQEEATTTSEEPQGDEQTMSSEEPQEQVTADEILSNLPSGLRGITIPR